MREGVEGYLKTLKTVKKVDISFFENWKQTLFGMIDEKITSLSDRITIKEFLMILVLKQNLKDCNFILL